MADARTLVLIFEKAIFLHVPKTGGTWVKEAVKNARVECEEFLIDGDPHGDLSCCPHRDRFVFAFVREPVRLYQSYWRYKTAAGWDDRNPFDEVCAAPTFDAFVEHVLRFEPAWCSRMFNDYVGPPAQEIDFVGRYERLAEDLIWALEMSGTRVNKAAILETPPVNVSTVSLERASLSADFVRRINASELGAISRFDYPNRAIPERKHATFLRTASGFFANPVRNRMTE